VLNSRNCYLTTKLYFLLYSTRSHESVAHIKHAVDYFSFSPASQLQRFVLEFHQITPFATPVPGVAVSHPGCTWISLTGIKTAPASS